MITAFIVAGVWLALSFLIGVGAGSALRFLSRFDADETTLAP
jgi:hypothetical protein